VLPPLDCPLDVLASALALPPESSHPARIGNRIKMTITSLKMSRLRRLRM
jgi:hypothetical protein